MTCSRGGSRPTGLPARWSTPTTPPLSGWDRVQTRALIAAADADTGPRAFRTAALIRVLATTEVADLGTERGHRVVRVIRKGGGKARLPLPPATWSALEATYLA